VRYVGQHETDRQLAELGWAAGSLCRPRMCGFLYLGVGVVFGPALGWKWRELTLLKLGLAQLSRLPRTGKCADVVSP
jgi:hypothetical protein